MCKNPRRVIRLSDDIRYQDERYDVITTVVIMKVMLDEGTSDEGETGIGLKRVRRVSDVIDSIGEPGEEVPSGYCTPRTTETDNEVFLESPEQDTPESVAVFKPDWLTQKKTSDLLDAGLSSLHSCSQEAADLSQLSGASGVSATMTVHKDANEYNMSHKYRGKCIVFNHDVFDTGFPFREGSVLDAKRIDKTFSNLGFEVEILENLEHSKVIEKINELSAEDHSDNDCICIFMLTHGLEPDLIFAKDVAYNAEKLWKPFTADKCPTLAGKPKLFFFQACRGKLLDAGVELKHSRLAPCRTEVDSATTSYTLPTHADFLIAHSTVQGHYSWRNPDCGTWFIQCLCDAIDEHHQTTHLQKILTICSRRIATDFASYNDLYPTANDQKQVPSITSMLIRDIYFTPK
ncbi:caspase-1 isoform X2 [Diachasma alloeum]|uniref:caspase-1 isoform X2 n=1 Tax=Diachasma alloeum TaxID=454923 RepID=UPI0007384F82|nr:caspase-1 isoform X2 [Diachasma alloeum]